MRGIVWLLLMVILGGCGSSSTSSTSASSSGGATGPVTGIVTYRFQVDATLARTSDAKLRALARAVPALTESYQATGRDALGQVVFGPATFPAGPELVLTGVPQACRVMTIEYRFQQTVLGRVETPLDLTANPNPVITDPEFVTVSTLSALQVTPPQALTEVGLPQSFTAQATFSDGRQYDVSSQSSWTSSNQSVATVDATGRALAAGPGTSLITATVMGVSTSATLTVASEMPTTLQVTPTNAQSGLGETRTFVASAVFANGTITPVNATWTSSDPTVANVDANGTATALNVGSTSIQARSGNLTAAANLSVSGPSITGLEVSPTAFSLNVFNTQQLTARARLADGTQQDVTAQATWTHSQPLAAAVGPTGLVTALFRGNCSITAAFSGQSASANCTVTDNAPVGPPPPVFTLSTPSQFEDISSTASLMYFNNTTAPTLGDDQTIAGVPIGFTFPYGSQSFTTFNLCSNGFISFTSLSTAFNNVPFPTGGPPDRVAAFWDDLFPPPGVSVPWVFVQTLGTAPNRRCVIEWSGARSSAFLGAGGITFELILFEVGNAEVRYLNTVFGAATVDEGRRATAGFQDAAGTQGATYCFDGAPNLLLAGTRVQFFLQGVLP